MKAEYKAFLDDLHALFKKHGVTNMVTLDDENDEDVYRIKFSIRCDDIIINNYNRGKFENVCAPETYYADKGEQK